MSNMWIYVICGVLAIFTRCEQDGPYVDGSQADLISLTLYVGGQSYKTYPDQSQILFVKGIHRADNITGAEYEISKGATIDPDPAAMTNWTKEQTFTVTSSNGEKSNTYRLILEDLSEWELVFNDEFDGNAYNPANWSSYETQPWSVAWNKYVVPNEPSLAEVKNGALHLRARWNFDTDLPETGAIQSLNKYSFKYGKLEVRAKFSRSGQGGWPAIWLMPQHPIYNGWPDGGEIDVMERLNNDNFVYQVIHQAGSKGSKTTNIDPMGYNTYGIIKVENAIEFLVNGKTTFIYKKDHTNGHMWPFETDFYIILNYACADKGTSGINFWPGLVTNTDHFPYEMVVDYVKVWGPK